MHLVGGLVGTLLVGLFASSSAPEGVDGLLHGGGWGQLWRQAAGAGAVLVYSLVVSWVLAWLVKVLVGFRLRPEDEAAGVDESEHAETGYHFGDGRRLRAGEPDREQADREQADREQEVSKA